MSVGFASNRLVVHSSDLLLKYFHRSFKKSLMWRPPKEILGIFDSPFLNTDFESFTSSFFMVFLFVRFTGGKPPLLQVKIWTKCSRNLKLCKECIYLLYLVSISKHINIILSHQNFCRGQHFLVKNVQNLVKIKPFQIVLSTQQIKVKTSLTLH